METEPSFYAIIPANVRYDEDLTPNAKLLYGEITAMWKKRGYCWSGNEYFADLYKVSTTSISKWIGQLSKKGHIKIVGRNEKRKIYNPMCFEEKLKAPEVPLRKVKSRSKEKLKDINTMINTKNGAYQKVMDTYWNSFQEKTGNKPLIDASTGKMVKDLLKSQDAAVVCACIETYFKNNFWFVNGQYSFRQFRAHYNDILSVTRFDRKEELYQVPCPKCGKALIGGSYCECGYGGE